ncbi:MAG: O-antigen ligase family protein, partial [Deltaproteobacteria bacterium]|nr:O-antigen ligase family protein [Deltaproteobacteria bacterium]
MEQGDERTPPGLVERCTDGLLAVLLVVIPLIFTSAVREYSSIKSMSLILLTGALAVLAAFSPQPVRLRNWFGFLVAALIIYCAGLVLLHPSADSISAASYLTACGLLFFLIAGRVAAWSDRRLAICIGLPLFICLGLSLIQATGCGLLAATRLAFGTTHGRLVGTIGNPNENTWYLLLGSILLASFIFKSKRRYLALVVFVLVALVVTLNRSRATALVIPLAGLFFLGRNWSGRLRRLSGIALLVLSGLALAGFFYLKGERALAGRVYLARISIGMIANNFCLPAGPGGYARDYPVAQANLLQQQPEYATYYSQIEHAHCDLLELFYELGVFGLIILGWLVWLALKRQNQPWLRATLAAGFLLSSTGYLLFSPAAATLMILAMGLWVGRLPAGQQSLFRLPAFFRTIGLCLAGSCLVVVAIFGLYSELRLTQALKTFETGHVKQAGDLFEVAVQTWPTADALFYLGNF